LFALYVNDCEMDFINHNCDPIELKELSLFLIMYADDMVIFSETAEGLQAMLDTLYDHNEVMNTIRLCHISFDSAMFVLSK
jgi:hypothetical protein